MLLQRRSEQEFFSLLSGGLLAASLLLAGCGGGAAAKPEMPQSVSPGWTMKGFDSTAKPADVPGTPQCWKAAYTETTDKGAASAEAVVCGYTAESGAFDAQQRAKAEAQAVKFQEGKYFVLVNWKDATKTNITALVRAIQKNLSAK